MDFLEQARREQKALQNSVARENRGMQRAVAKNQRDMQRGIAKSLKFSISKEGRIRIDAKTRDKVYEKCKRKCHYPKCPITLKSSIPMNIHHINMKNNDNRVSNLELLCANHHYLKHKKAFRRKYHSYDIIKGSQTRTRLIKKNTKSKHIRKQKVINNPFTFSYKPQKFRF